MPSTTSPPTTHPSCASCAVMSLNSLTAPTPRAGGGAAEATWVTSRRNTCSQFTSASELKRCQSNAGPLPRVPLRPIKTPPLDIAPPLCTCTEKFLERTSDELLLICYIFFRVSHKRQPVGYNSPDASVIAETDQMWTYTLWTISHTHAQHTHTHNHT